MSRKSRTNTRAVTQIASGSYPGTPSVAPLVVSFYPVQGLAPWLLSRELQALNMPVFLS